MDSPLLPTTAAGRRLFTDMEPMDMWESDGVTPEDIAAVEAEAAAAALAGVRREVEALPYGFRQHTCWDGHEGPDAEHPHLDGSPCLDRVTTDAVDRAAVLALLTPEPAP